MGAVISSMIDRCLHGGQEDCGRSHSWTAAIVSRVGRIRRCKRNGLRRDVRNVVN
jgi:hypothetical protein